MTIPVYDSRLDGREKEYLLQCIESGWISSEGPLVARFEQEFSERVGRRFGIAVSSGSAALEVAVAALRLGPEDEVIVPSFTIISCAAAIVRAGAKPLFVDADPSTWNLDIGHLERLLHEEIVTKGNDRIKAMLVVHTYGLPVDMDPVMEIARRYHLQIIEDAAQMHGQTYGGVPCGRFGALSAFSFYANKLVTTGEGGMVLTDDPELDRRCRSLRNLCFVAGRRFYHEELGWNYRMSSLQAAVGLAQLEQLDRSVRRKREIGARYENLLANVLDVQRPLSTTPYAKNGYWVYGIVLADRVRFDGAELMRRLGERGIGTRPFFYPLHLQPALLATGLIRRQRLPVAERLGERGVYLPGGLTLSDEQIEGVAKAVTECLR